MGKRGRPVGSKNKGKRTLIGDMLGEKALRSIAELPNVVEEEIKHIEGGGEPILKRMVERGTLGKCPMYRMDCGDVPLEGCAWRGEDGKCSVLRKVGESNGV